MFHRSASSVVVFFLFRLAPRVSSTYIPLVSHTFISTRMSTGRPLRRFPSKILRPAGNCDQVAVARFVRVLYSYPFYQPPKSTFRGSETSAQQLPNDVSCLLTCSVSEQRNQATKNAISHWNLSCLRGKRDLYGRKRLRQQVRVGLFSFPPPHLRPFPAYRKKKRMK